MEIDGDGQSLTTAGVDVEDSETLTDDDLVRSAALESLPAGLLSPALADDVVLGEDVVEDVVLLVVVVALVVDVVAVSPCASTEDFPVLSSSSFKRKRCHCERQ